MKKLITFLIILDSILGIALFEVKTEYNNINYKKITSYTCIVKKAYLYTYNISINDYEIVDNVTYNIHNLYYKYPLIMQNNFLPKEENTDIFSLINLPKSITTGKNFTTYKASDFANYDCYPNYSK